MKRIIIICSLGLLLAGCNQPVSKIYDGDSVTITIGADNHQEKIYYSQLFDSVKYIPLEINDDCIIGIIDKIIYYDNRFYILDSKQNILFVFSDTGEFIWKIDKRGNGPGEYLYIRDFDLSNNHLYLLDPRRNVLEYDLSGNYINNYSLNNIYGTSIFVNNEFFYINTCNNPSTEGNYHLLLMDNYGKTFKNGIPITQKNLVGRCITFNNRNSFFRYQDRIRFYMPFSTKVFSIAGDSIYVQYDFDFKNNNLPENFFNRNTYEDLKNYSSYAYGFNSFWENDSYLSFIIKFNNNDWDVVYFKTENKSLYGSFYDDMAFCFPAFHVVNNDYAIGFRTMDELFAEYNYSKEDRINTVVGEIVEKSDEEDNPVLFIYFFKKII